MAHSNPITIGMLAHVDAGKTTLSEAILYSAGSIRKLGRVDNQDTFLDTGDMERARGITIFSKQAAYNYNGSSYTLLDTPGHVDFSAETERTLWAHSPQRNSRGPAGTRQRCGRVLRRNKP